MRSILSTLFLLSSLLVAQAQTIATFESLSLPKAKDTAYINYSKYGEDVGFSDGLAYFPCVYDTSWGLEFWSSGFAYSNYTDTNTSGFGNQYSAKTGKGFASSANYVVSYGNNNKISLTGAAAGQSIFGMYITNSTYAFNSMRDGDAFSKKFNATDKDYFRLDIFGYLGGTRKRDSVSFYLADFRFTDTTKNYIVRDWQWVDLLKLGKVDSIEFVLHSSDVGSFGMNTPAYFCIDNFMTNETGLSVERYNTQADLKVYPNPATDKLFIESGSATSQTLRILNATGHTLGNYKIDSPQLALDIRFLPDGLYFLQIDNGNQTLYHRFVKQ